VRGYNRDLGVEPPARSRAESLVRGSGGQSRLKAESFLAFQRLMKQAKFAPLTVSGTLSFCDVCDRLNMIPNTFLLKTEKWVN